MKMILTYFSEAALAQDLEELEVFCAVLAEARYCESRVLGSVVKRKRRVRGQGRCSFPVAGCRRNCNKSESTAGNLQID